jgi:carbamoyl-phosphate synthase large subunit
VYLKASGFSDRRLAALLSADADAVRARRHALGVRPVYKRVDTCAAEFATETAYMYSTYEEECEAEPSGRKKVMVLGGGPNRIGQGIEFDYCCVHAAFALREDGYETIMVNCNPETVSTDYDTSDRLYFEPLTLEDVLEIVAVEKPLGVIVQYGGQTPLKLALALEANGVPIVGTSPESIDVAEDRERFQKLLMELGLKQPPNRTARTEADAIRLAAEIGYPLVVRPSYVLGGRAMEIVHEQKDLERYMREAVKVSNDSPVLLDRFLNDAIEVDVDCICDGEQVLIGGVMEHIEQAGVHSGDSACSLPPYSLSKATVRGARAPDRADGARARRRRPDERAVRRSSAATATATADSPGGGADEVYVLEVNPRASRTVPYVSKATGVPAGQDRRPARCWAARWTSRAWAAPSCRPTTREGGGLPVRQVPGRRHDPRARDEVHRRGDGRGAPASAKPSSSRSWAPACACPRRARCSCRCATRTSRARWASPATWSRWASGWWPRAARPRRSPRRASRWRW